MIVRTAKGWQIKSHKTGKIYPKVYTSHASAEKRISQMKKFKKIKGR